MAIGAWAVGLLTTVVVNVGINIRTAGWSPEESPDRWRAMRRRWEWFQGFRSWAFLASFVTVAWAVAAEVV